MLLATRAQAVFIIERPSDREIDDAPQDYSAIKSIESNSNVEMLLVVEAFRKLLNLIVRDRSSTSVGALAERKLLWLLELGNRLRHSTAP